VVKRTVLLGVAGVVGLLVGTAAAFAWQDQADEGEQATTQVEPVVESLVPTTSVPSGESPPSSEPSGGPEVLLAWTAGGLPPGFGAAVDHLEPIDALTVVRGGTVDLVRSRDPSGMPVDEAPAGMAIPLDAIAVDPSTYPGVVPEGDQEVFRGLEPGQALLGSSSAELRGLDAGAVLELSDGTSLQVVGVIDDALVGAAEVVVRTGPGAGESAGLGIDRERYLLFTIASDSRVAVEEAVRSLAPGVPMRVRAPGETPYLRSSDAVLPQVLIKEVFGEFAYVPPGAGQRDFRQQPGWADEHLVQEEVPLLGTVRCHRSLMPALQGAMQDLVDEGLGELVGTHQGCWNPRLIVAGGSVSRHAFGAAVDLNFSSNPTGSSSMQDDRLVEVMERWGFVSGDDWLVPDSGHFEYVSAPS
jgi:hypothetical protein